MPDHKQNKCPRNNVLISSSYNGIHHFALFGGHIGRHFEYFKTLKGDKRSPAGILERNICLTRISKEKNYIRNFQVQGVFAIFRRDY